MRPYFEHPAFVRQNARFWAWINSGWVKLTLRPGQVIEHTEGGPHEEGYSYRSTRWELAADEPVVYRSWINEGSDCDGRLDQYGKDECQLIALGLVLHDGEDSVGIATPDWINRSRSQRDYAAEAMGY